MGETSLRLAIIVAIGSFFTYRRTRKEEVARETTIEDVESANKIGDKMEDESKDEVKDIMITCNTCGFEVDYETPCPNGCDTEVTEMVNRIFGEGE